MAVSCDLNVDNATPNHGDTITVTYEVTGNDAVDPSQATISGRVVIAGENYDVTTTVTLPGTDAADVTYETPTCDELEFEATSDETAFTAVVP
jgi:hypothetical protein